MVSRAGSRRRGDAGNLNLQPSTLFAQGLAFTASNYNVGYYPRSVVSTDFNGDGKVDVVCANYCNNTPTLLTNASAFTACKSDCSQFY